jgi:hypothetical protein
VGTSHRAKSVKVEEEKEEEEGGEEVMIMELE